MVSMSFETIFSIMDSLLLPFFGLSASPAKSYLIGVLFLALLANLIGEVFTDIIFRKNMEEIARLKAEADKLGELAMLALSVDNLQAYEACNRRANENFSRLFYLSIATSAAYLWAGFLTLGWLQSRFMGRVEYQLPFTLPGFPGSFGYAGAFILAYALVYVFFKLVKPYFWKVPEISPEEVENSILSPEEIKEMIERLKKS
jgi:hypothetical protein